MNFGPLRGLGVAVCAGLVAVGGTSTAATEKDKVILTTSALDFSPTFSCSAVNVSSASVSVTIELLSPQTGALIGNSVAVATTLQPGYGSSNEFTLSVGFTSAYCKVTHSGNAGSVRAAACAKAAQNAGCQAASEAR